MSEATLDRQSAAEFFLQEAVYRSREKQASGAPLGADADGTEGNCGLGAKAAVELDLSPRGTELFETLWPSGLSPDALASVHAAMTDWVKRQDGLDRKRNHFLKDFRHQHGFDRGQYDAEQAAAYRTGLDAVNAEVDAGRAEAAAALLAVS